MKQISIDIKNCFGIKKLDHTFEFKGNTRAIGVYAPNGSMKSSLCNTFKHIQMGKVEKLQDKFGNQSSININLDENPISCEQILVIDSFDGSMGSCALEESHTLMLNHSLAKKYNEITKDQTELEKQLFNSFESMSGLDRAGFISEIKKCFDYSNWTDILVEHEGVDDTLTELKYKDFFTSDLGKIIENENVKEGLEGFLKKVNSSEYFKNGFDVFGLFNIGKCLKKYKFFSRAGNRITITDDKNQNEFDSIDLINQFIKDNMGEVAEEIIGLLDKNSSSRGISNILKERPDLVLLLSDIKEFKKKVLKAYINKEKNNCSQLLKKNKENEKNITNIKKLAKEEEDIWVKTLKIFKERFTVPFDIEVLNKTDVSLEISDIPRFKFVHSRDGGNEKYKTEEIEDMNFLSTGEKKALYILKVIFQIELKREESEDFLVIFDDVVDSFDYRNKFAVIQYLKDFIQDSPKIYSLILTHNFDFFRNLSWKRVLHERDCRFIATNKEGDVQVKLFNSQIIKNAFKGLCENNLCPEEIISVIPFLRTLEVEFKESVEKKSEQLNAMLHVQKLSGDQTAKILKGIYKDTIGRELSSKEKFSDETKVHDYIEKIATDITEIDENELYKKLCMAIYVRLLGERLCIIKQSLDVDGINDSSCIFDNFIQDKTMIEENKELIRRVNINTPEYIHINAFMYEPLIDQSADILLQLRDELLSLLSKTQ